jgi:hypothetical protein
MHARDRACVAALIVPPDRPADRPARPAGAPLAPQLRPVCYFVLGYLGLGRSQGAMRVRLGKSAGMRPKRDVIVVWRVGMQIYASWGIL